MFESGLCDWLVLPLLGFRLRQPSFHWIINGGVVNGIGRNGNVLILPTPIPSSLWLLLRLRILVFTIGHKLSYDSDYDSDSDSVASENQPLIKFHVCLLKKFNIILVLINFCIQSAVLEPSHTKLYFGRLGVVNPS